MSEALSLGVRGGGVSLLGQAAKLVIQFASLVTLSRLLGPEDFGLLAMVTAFVAFGELIRDFGTSIVGLQRRSLDQQQSSNLFWLAVALGATSAVLLVAITPLVAGLYSEPRVADIMVALAVGVLLNAAAAQFQVHLARGMRFGRLVLADVSAQLAGLLVAVGGALRDWGYWALVAQVLTVASLGFGLRWWLSGWLPSRPRRGHENRKLVGDSFAFGLAQLLNFVSKNIDSVVIGAKWSAVSLGGYNRAFQLLTRPLDSIIGPLTSVVIPTVNRARDEGRTADFVLLRLQFALGMPIAWIYAVSAATAPWLIPFLLGDQWQEAVPIFQILAVGGVVWAFSRVSYWGFIAANLGRQLLFYNLVTKTIATALIVAASFHSIAAIAWAVSVGLVISWPINLVWLARTAGQDSWAYWRNGLCLVAAAGACFVVSAAAFRYLSFDITVILVGAAALAGTLTYALALMALPTSRRGVRSTVRYGVMALRSRG